MTSMKTALILIGLSACSRSKPQQVPIDGTRAKELVAAADRTDKDREKDKQRKPADLLVFTGVAPGMHVADLGAGGGYKDPRSHTQDLFVLKFVKPAK